MKIREEDGKLNIPGEYHLSPSLGNFPGIIVIQCISVN